MLAHVYLVLRLGKGIPLVDFVVIEFMDGDLSKEIRVIASHGFVAFAKSSLDAKPFRMPTFAEILSALTKYGSVTAWILGRIGEETQFVTYVSENALPK